MLISVRQGSSADAVRLSRHCNTNCKLHTDEGHGCFSGAFEGFCVRSFRYLLFVQDAAKGALFAFVRCYCLRVVVRVCVLRVRGCACLHACTLFALVCACTLFVAVYLPFARLSLLLQYFVHLARFRAFMWLFLQPLLLQPLLCTPRSEIQRLGGAKIGSSGTSPPPPWVRFIVCASRPRPAAISLQ